MRRTKRLGVALVAALVVALAACGGSSQYQPPASASPGPSLVVERFLQAANGNDLDTMTQLFGTATKGIVELDGRQQAEQRMYVLASLLRHSDFAMQGQRVVPGRRDEAAEVIVQLTIEDEPVVVPFVVVRRKGGGWVIERVDVTAITNS